MLEGSRQPEPRESLLRQHRDIAAEKLDPQFPDTYVYRGKVYLNTNQVPAAIQEYRRALEIDPTLEDARHDLAIAEGRLRAGR